MSRAIVVATAISCVPLAMSACTRPPQSAVDVRARNLVLVTVDTLRADHVGAYGYARAHTPALDRVARGVRFEQAYAAAPITLPSHATLLTGRYPPGHGARDNGLPVSPSVPTLTTQLHAIGFKTAAFVAAFPLDRQFGLNRGFDVYSDRLGRDATGRPADERSGSQVIDEAIAWLSSIGLPAPPAPPAPRFFLWVHLFEPHAPYGTDTSRPVLDRYDEEIAAADREIGRLLSALAPVRHDTIVVVAGDHGEAFGEHGEYAHSIFVYDTTLRVPLLMEGPGAAGNDGSAPRVVGDAVTLADVAPTVARLLGIEMPDVDGIDVSPAIAGGRLPSRELYAESFAPLLEFGWAPLRALRAGTWKFIAAPTPELFDLAHDPGEQTNVAAGQAPVAARLGNRVDRYAGADLPGTSAPNPAAAERLRALGYSAGARRETGTARPDPKDRREMAARIALVTSGELTGPRLATALESIVRDDPRNGQAHLRLGFARLQTGDCARAEPEFHAAIASGVPSVDPYLGLATCLGRRNDLQGAARALAEARRLEPASPILAANEGILHAATGDLPAAITSLQAALAGDPDLHEARFNLALAYAKSGRRADAAAAARDLLQRLPARSPQRAEVERLLRAVQ